MDHSIGRYTFAVLLLPLALHAELPSASSDDYPPIVPFDLGADPAFANYRKAIGDYVHVKPGHHTDVCIVGEHDPNGARSALVIWKAGHKIITWGGSESLSDSRSIIDLRHDVVKSQDEINGSTYLVTQGWVDYVSSICEKSGVKVKIPDSK